MLSSLSEATLVLYRWLLKEIHLIIYKQRLFRCVFVSVCVCVCVCAQDNLCTIEDLGRKGKGL